MTEIIALTLLLLIGVASPGGVGIPPQAFYEAGLRGSRPPPCRALSPGEMREEGLDQKGKAATLSLRGEYRCEHAIFDYGERDSYADFVVRQAPARAAGDARQAARLTAQVPALAGKQWTVVVRNGPAPLRAHLTSVFQQALAGALGAGRAGRAAVPDGVTLNVRLRQVQDADLLFDVTATRGLGEDVSTWRF